jgi:hypothetical protein
MSRLELVALRRQLVDGARQGLHVGARPRGPSVRCTSVDQHLGLLQQARGAATQRRYSGCDKPAAAPTTASPASTNSGPGRPAGCPGLALVGRGSVAQASAAVRLPSAKQQQQRRCRAGGGRQRGLHQMAVALHAAALPRASSSRTLATSSLVEKGLVM